MMETRDIKLHVYRCGHLCGPMNTKNNEFALTSNTTVCFSCDYRGGIDAVFGTDVCCAWRRRHNK